MHKKSVELFRSVHEFRPTGIYLWGMSIRKATLDRWYKEGLSRNVDPLEYFGVNRFDNISYFSNMDPPFEEQVIEETDEYRIWIDELGSLRKDFKENLDSGFVTRSYLRFAVENEQDFEDLKKRYEVDHKRCMWSEDDIQMLNDRKYPADLLINGFFWALRDWVGFENLCIWFYEKEKLVREMLEFWCGFLTQVLDRSLAKLPADVPTPDFVIIHKDMAYKGHPMIGPDMMRDFMGRHYRAVVDVLHKYGINYIYVDCDGDPTLLIPEWLKVGINGTFPIEIAAGIDPVALRKEYGRELYMIGGIDKRELAKSREDIRKEVRSKVLPLAQMGGYIPGVDHAVPADISFDNHKYYVESVYEAERELFGE
jgi:Uroporphyrinogen decarboxylase (URO-D)